MNSNKKESENWKLGLFYFNPKDKSIIVPKRFGFGISFNFAQPLGVIFGLVIVVVVIALVITLK